MSDELQWDPESKPASTCCVAPKKKKQIPCSRDHPAAQSWDDWDAHFQRVLLISTSTDVSALIKSQEFHPSLLFSGKTQNMGNFTKTSQSSPAEIGTESQLSHASAINGTIFPHKNGSDVAKVRTAKGGEEQ